MIDCLTQKVELNYLIPAIRKEFIAIFKKKSLSDAEISRKLKVTKAAISQYVHKKRGRKIKFSREIEKDIHKSALSILKGKSANVEINNLIKKLKKSRYICVICKECECKGK